jgi:hypothetical protein
MSADVLQIVSSISTRMFSAIENGLKECQTVHERGENKIARAWESLALEGIKEIEKAGSLAPGLSHQGIYIEELKNAHKEADSTEGFLANIEKMKSKWGSRIKYPLYAGGRKKELDGLTDKIQKNISSEERRVRESVDRSLATEIERVQTATSENINFAVVDFRGLLIDALDWPKDANLVIELRWFMIGIMSDSIFKDMSEKLGEEHGRNRDLLYLALERVMRAIYESFQHVVKKSTKSAGEDSSHSAHNLRSLIAAEIQQARKAVAEFETKLNKQKLSGQIISSVRRGLKSGSDSVTMDAKLFAEVSGGLRGDRTLEQFLIHLKNVPGLLDQDREEVITTVKTAIEPFRSLYYAKINYVRYMKGLKKFQESLVA